jgi:hypothetical protein
MSTIVPVVILVCSHAGVAMLAWGVRSALADDEAARLHAAAERRLRAQRLGHEQPACGFWHRMRERRS